MAFLETELLGNLAQQWMIAIVAGLAVAIGLRMLARTLVRRLSALSQTTDTGWDDIITEVLEKTKGWFLLIVAVFAASLLLDLPERVRDIVERVMVVGVIVQGGIWAGALLTGWLLRYRQRQLAEDPATVTTVSAMGFVGKVLLWAGVLLLMLDNLGVDITTLVAGIGIGGLAVAFALQNILGDLFASLSIVLDKPFVLRDFLKVGDFVGNVEHIGLKTTRLRALSGEQLVFSNTDLLGSRIQNFGRLFERRIAFTIGVTYQATKEQLEKIPEILKEAVEPEEEARFDRAHWTGYGDFSLDFECVYFVLEPDFALYRDIQQAINLRIFERFAEEGIEFAYPTQTLFVAKEGD